MQIYLSVTHVGVLLIVGNKNCLEGEVSLGICGNGVLEWSESDSLVGLLPNVEAAHRDAICETDTRAIFYVNGKHIIIS